MCLFKLDAIQIQVGNPVVVKAVMDIAEDNVIPMAALLHLVGGGGGGVNRNPLSLSGCTKCRSWRGLGLFQ